MNKKLLIKAGNALRRTGIFLLVLILINGIASALIIYHIFNNGLHKDFLLFSTSAIGIFNLIVIIFIITDFFEAGNSIVKAVSDSENT